MPKTFTLQLLRALRRAQRRNRALHEENHELKAMLVARSQAPEAQEAPYRLSHGELAQMAQAADMHFAVGRNADKSGLMLLEEELVTKWARGELVEVHRCKDCKWAEGSGEYRTCMCSDADVTYCESVHEDFYCPFGKKRGEEDEGDEDGE